MARVRNLKGIGSTKPIQSHIFIPPKFTAVVKIEIITSSNTYDITDFVENGSWTEGATEGIGSFDFNITDPNKDFSNNVSAYDTIKIYMDYSSSATTLRFKGRIERSGREDYKFIISGRSEGIVIMGKNINYSADNKKKSDVLKEIIEDNFDDVTVNNIEEDTSLINVNYSEIPFIEIVNEIIGDTHAFYIDVDLDANYFEKGSRQNITEAVVEGTNHIATEEFSSDSEETVTKVRVYGKSTNGLPLIATSDSSTTSTGGVIKESIVRDDSMLTFTQAQEKADNSYSTKQNIPNIGSVRSTLLPTLKPGEQVKLFIPMDKIDPAFYNIQSYTHIFPEYQTSLNIQQKRLSVSKLISKGKVFQSKITGESNPNDMDYSLIYDFSTDSGSHTNTVIDTLTQTLKTDGSATGTWISPQTDTQGGGNVSAIEVRAAGNNIEGLKIFLSLNGGLTFTSSYLPEGTTVSIPPGDSIIVKVFVPSAETVIDAIGVYYKT